MSKAIKITEELLEKCKEEFINALKNEKFPDGKITFSKSFEDKNRKATVLFTEKAWLRMNKLIDGFSTEVGWHGIAKRGEKLDEYVIENILVYPQEVTGATVTPDQEKYQNWLMEQEDDVFNNIRMQGHSHVNMSVTPSSVDLSLYERILSQLDDDMFYIFMIWNKRGERTIKIYDIRENTLFETKDISVKIMQQDLCLETFFEESEKMVEEKKYNTNKTYANWKNKNKKEEDKKEDLRKGYPKNTQGGGVSLKPYDDSYDDDYCWPSYGYMHGRY